MKGKKYVFHIALNFKPQWSVFIIYNYLKDYTHSRNNGNIAIFSLYYNSVYNNTVHNEIFSTETKMLSHVGAFPILCISVLGIKLSCLSFL